MSLLDSFKGTAPKNTQPAENDSEIYLGTRTRIFKIYSYEELADNMGIVAMAHDDAAKGLPASDQPTRYATDEMNIDLHLKKIAQEYDNTAISLIQNRDNSFNESESQTRRMVEEITHIPAEFDRRVDAYKADHDDEYLYAKDKYFDAYNEYTEFRTVNKLTRSATIKRDVDKLASAMVVLAIVFVEGILNAYFFSTNLDSGLLGGFMYAIIASAANALPLTFAGYFARYVNHVRFSLKLFGILAVIFGLLWTCSAAVIIGHMRDMIGDTGTLGNLADLGVNVFSLEFSNTESYILVGITLLCGFIAAMDGYFFDDRYPGFSRVEQIYWNASSEWDGYVKNRRDNLTDLWQGIEKMIDEKVHLSNNAVNHMKKLATEKQNILNSYAVAYDGLASSFHSLISIYRTENQKVRKDPAPAYFYDKVEFTEKMKLTVAAESAEDDRIRIREAEENREKAVRLADEAHTRVRQLFSQYEDEIDADRGARK